MKYKILNNTQKSNTAEARSSCSVEPLFSSSFLSLLFALSSSRRHSLELEGELDSTKNRPKWKHYEFNARFNQELVFIVTEMSRRFFSLPSLAASKLLGAQSWQIFILSFVLSHSCAFCGSANFERQNIRCCWWMKWTSYTESDWLIWIQFNANLILHKKSSS